MFGEESRASPFGSCPRHFQLQSQDFSVCVQMSGRSKGTLVQMARCQELKVVTRQVMAVALPEKLMLPEQGEKVQGTVTRVNQKMRLLERFIVMRLRLCQV